MPYTDTKVGAVESSVSLPTEIQRSQAIRGDLTSAVKELYSVCIYDIQTKKVIDSPGLDPKGKGGYTTAEYYFTVPPKSHEMTEPYATNIVATQNNGKFIESQGVIFRDITIAGSTGLRPNKLTRDALPILKEIPLFGGAISAMADDLVSLTDSPFGPRGLPNRNERTGFDDIIFLRNIFRRYSDLKSSESSYKYLMLWRNAKDADYWVVEPVTFKLSQDASSPMTYGYNISFKTIARFDAKFNVPKDGLDIGDKVSALANRLGEVDRVLRNSFYTLANQIDKVEAIGVRVSTDLLSPIITVLEGINNIQDTVDNFGVAFQQNLMNLSARARDAMRIIDEHVAESPDVPAATSAFAEPSRAVKRLLPALALALTSTASIKPKSQAVAQTLSRAAEAYRFPPDSQANSRRASGTAGTPNRPGGGGDPQLTSTPITGNFSRVRVQLGDSIKSLAKKVLGNANKWKTLVVVNNLKPPFIATIRQPDVLIPGDWLLYPSTDGVSSGETSLNTKEQETANDISGANSEIERTYGRDLHLDSVTEGSAYLTDIKVDEQLGDLATIAGVPNVEQGLQLKFSTEQGQLPAHPGYGAQFPIGKKIGTKSFNTFRIQAQNTILSDPRVESIQLLDFTSKSDTMVITSILKLIKSGTLSTNLFVGA